MWGIECLFFFLPSPGGSVGTWGRTVGLSCSCIVHSVSCGCIVHCDVLALEE